MESDGRGGGSLIGCWLRFQRKVGRKWQDGSVVVPKLCLAFLAHLPLQVKHVAALDVVQHSLLTAATAVPLKRGAVIGANKGAPDEAAFKVSKHKCDMKMISFFVRWGSSLT